MFVAKANNAVAREKAFPIKLHAARVASDTAVSDLVNTFKELTRMLDNDILDLEKSDSATASSMREVAEVLKDSFDHFHTHVLQRDSSIAKDFEEYSKSYEPTMHGHHQSVRY